MAITAPAYMAQKQLPASMGTASALSKTMIIILVCVRFPLLFLFIVKFSMWTASAKNGFVQYNRFQNILKVNALTLNHNDAGLSLRTGRYSNDFSRLEQSN